MRIQTEKDREITSICHELDDIMARMKSTVHRKQSAAKMNDGRHCIRIQKFHANEKLELSTKDKVEFTVGKNNYEGNLQATAEFPDELILIIGDLKTV